MNTMNTDENRYIARYDHRRADAVPPSYQSTIQSRSSIIAGRV